jgi:manganese/zinc/iron transport system permease protein
MNGIQVLLDSPAFTIVAIGALVGVAASLLGTFLVLRRESMLSDAISHSVLLGIVLAFLITGSLNSIWHVTGAAVVGLFTVLLSDQLARTGRVPRDAAIGLVFPAFFALAVLLINLFARNVHVDTDSVLLGEIAFAWLDTVVLGELRVARSLVTMGAIALVNTAFVVAFFKELKMGSFDPALAQAQGFRPQLTSTLLLALLSITAVGAFEAVGAILLVAFVVVPATAAYLLTDRLGAMLAISSAIAIASSLMGFGIARHLDTTIGGSMAASTGVFLILALLFAPKYGTLARLLRRRQSGGQRSVMSTPGGERASGETP